MRILPKITPADYPDLLAAVDEGLSQRDIARRYNCAHSLVARHVARAKRSREPSESEHHPGETTASHEGSINEILEARICDPRTSARDLASLVNSLIRLEAKKDPHVVEAPPRQRSGSRVSIRELKNPPRFQLSRFMPGVNEWFDALPPDAEEWMHLPDAPVELVDQYGDAHHVLAEEASFFCDQLGWATPSVWEPEDDVIEEWRVKIAEYDARKVREAESGESRALAHVGV